MIAFIIFLPSLKYYDVARYRSGQRGEVSYWSPGSVTLPGRSLLQYLHRSHLHYCPIWSHRIICSFDSVIDSVIDSVTSTTLLMFMEFPCVRAGSIPLEDAWHCCEVNLVRGKVPQTLKLGFKCIRFLCYLIAVCSTTLRSTAH